MIRDWRFLYRRADSSYNPYYKLPFGFYYTDKDESTPQAQETYRNIRSGERIITTINDLSFYCDACWEWVNIPPNSKEMKSYQEKFLKIKKKFPMNIMAVFNDYQSFFKWACPELKKRFQISLKRILKAKYLKISQRKY